MDPSKEFDKLLAEMKHVERSEEAKRNTWLALKAKVETKRKRPIIPAFISLAIIAIASFLIFTYINSSETEQSSQAIDNEKIIRAVLEREYNGPDMELARLQDEWWDLQSVTETKNQEEYDQLLQSKKYTDLMDYYSTTHGEYFTENMLKNAIASNLIFKYNYSLIENSIEVHLENVKVVQEKEHPNIYRPIIEVSLTNNEGQKVFHTLKEEFIFSTSEPGKIGSYNGVRDGGGIELQEKIENFPAYVEDYQNVRTPLIDISFDTLCFNTRKNVQGEKVEFESGCTSDKSKINNIMENFDDLPIKAATEQESTERSVVLPQIDNYQIYLTNAADKGNTLYTITIFDDGVLMFATGADFGNLGDITIESHVEMYEKVRRMLEEFAENE
ncbi:hypothetical protein SAMN05421670_2982 [Psychrobacillus psychrotolerans]|uniref:Uncharacterized protein n=1 Tax=Psychrobacillus psychrotolerans TaxID=126156 RepID=A0A1I5ZYJ4_9BACI|nr:hypothetical protein [Psychrobacillus psychrotolerans]SFQ61526.1 hypothetical protein SAMN05421670_2982 [Psychrobacillus psychrotolerans]